MLIDVERIPQHVAIIMDGNGRWAQQLGRPRPTGHRAGSDAVRRTVRACRRLGVRGLTLYAFSEQNWDRPAYEVEALMGLLREFLVSERDEILDNAIRLRSIGNVERLPSSVREVLDPLVAESADHKGMTLTLALSYGGQEEIRNAVQQLAAMARDGQQAPDEISLDDIAALLPSMDLGPVDLMIRTGGEQRVSNFLLWGVSYAELYFCEELWPDFEAEDLYRAFAAYQARERRFGLVGASPDSAATSVAPSATLPSHV